MASLLERLRAKLGSTPEPPRVDTHDLDPVIDKLQEVESIVRKRYTFLPDFLDMISDSVKQLKDIRSRQKPAP